jgi:C4-dicarboxylate-binding protein DctP
MSRKPLKSADFHGLKMATIPHVKDALDYLGAATVTVTTMELYQAFERGVIDGATIPHGLNPYEWKVHEVAPYMLEPPIPITAMSNLLFNSKKWDGLPPDVKKLLEDTMAEIELDAHKYYVGVAAEYNEKMVKEGMQYVKLPPEEANKFIYAFSVYYWKKFIKRFPVWGPMLYEAVQPWMGAPELM